MQNLTITKVYREEKTSKAGKPFTSLRIQTKEHGQKWLSGFGNKQNEGWKEGDSVEVTVVQKGEYLNFEMPKFTKADNNKIAQDLSQILTKLGKLELMVRQIHEHASGKNKLNLTSAGTPIPFQEDDGLDQLTEEQM